MRIEVSEIRDTGERSRLCAEITAELPMWFGRPESNARYISGIASRECYAAVVDGQPAGLIALEYHFDRTCDIWWMGVRASAHRRGIGRALIARAVHEAETRGCRFLTVLTMGEKAQSPAYDATRRFYEAMGFVPLIAFEPEPGDHMLWMLRVNRDYGPMLN